MEETYPAAVAQPELVGHFTTLWTVTLVYNLRYWERKVGREITADDVEPLTWALAEMGRAVSAPDYVDAQHAIGDLGRERRGVVRVGLRPAAHADARRAAGARSASSRRPTSRSLGFIRAATFVPFTPLANMAGTPAISLPLCVERAGPADRVAAHGRVRARRPAPARRVATRDGTPVGRPPPAGARLSTCVTIAGGQGFYGDTPTAVDALLAEGVDYLCLEALAELTLAILQKDRQRDETRGLRARPSRVSRPRAPVRRRRSHEDHHERGRHQPRGRDARRGRDRARDGHHRHQDRDRARRRRAHAPRRAARRARPGASRTSTPPRRSRVDAVAAAVRRRVPRRPADRRRARAGRRHRDHRPGRRRVALPRAARVRARLGVGRLGPARGGHPRRPPARVLGPEPRRQLLGRLVGAPAPVGPAVPDRARRRRRHRGDHQARRARAAG